LEATDPGILELSALLRQLPIHPAEIQTESFRNPMGVYMKLWNFLAIDPEYTGKGLERGSKLDQKVWNEFNENWDYLSVVASAIRGVAKSSLLAKEIEQDSEINVNEEFLEGQILVRLHRIRERNPLLVKRKIKSVLMARRNLEREICGFNFENTYGLAGRGYIECHHKVPLATQSLSKSSRIDDLAIVCPNCHRIIHRGDKTKTIDEMRDIVNNNRSL